MKNSFTKIAVVAVVALALVQSLQATPIVGNIGFTGRAQLNTASASTATSVVGWVNTRVNGTDGAFTSVADNTAVAFLAPWFFSTPNAGNVGGLGFINNFWSVGGFTFQLLSSSVVAQGGVAGSTGYVTVSGTGIVSGNNYENTILSWSFTSQDPSLGSTSPSFTFSASSNSLPDGGATVALLGIALSGVGLLRKKLVA
jgi:hypothetical protein